MRMDEPLMTDPHRLAEKLAGELEAALDGPYALFGHSLGALVAFEVAHCLLDRGAHPALVLFASGTEAPSVRDGSKWRDPLNDEALLEELRGMKGTPDEALSSPELMQATLPVLRSDFLMCGAYSYRHERRLPCPIHVLGGRDDDTTAGSLEAWRRETAAGFEIDMVPGGHFFIHSRQEQVLDLISSSLARRGGRPWSVPPPAPS
jgi:surfactin synthase thioesterase subunit